ncbi:hypothetical protein CU097_005922 [Rhizopus azygosporus]|uniref:Uncharacterized protein n=1 Tax=Rhizopus azygosporus TaxID=86630 RepID=A0A367K920_RHIAZ|nr:hypothetical protein CU097_005922 [Rhizopus azygosporus]
MFHSSGLRHEQYLIRSKQDSKHTLHKKRSSLESEISAGADSGYTSSSFTPTCSINKKPHITGPPKKKKRYHQTPRQPDLVYSCPRPLAFPFHNDDHFLPIAEADPRDVARVSPPSINRASSIQSKSTTSISRHDADSSYSRRSSVLSSIQRGTVRSIRSLFQLPDSLSNLSQRTTQTSIITTDPPLERLEIKKGTVQSLKDFFSKRQPPQTSSSIVSPASPKRGQLGTTIGSIQTNKTTNDSRASLKKNSNSSSSSCTKLSSNPSSKKSFTSRASEFASRAFWKKPAESTTPCSAKQPNVSTTPRVDRSAAQKPLPEPPKKKTIKSEVKKISARVISSFRPTPNADKIDKPSKPSLFSFKKNNNDELLKKKPSTAATTIPEEPSKVGKLWKSFKNLMTGKKSSRVGVL